MGSFQFITKPRGRRKLGKITASLNEELAKVQWGEYRLGDLFEKINTKKVEAVEDGDLPATTAVLSNNQLGKKVSKTNATVLKSVISATANGFGRTFYQPKEFTVLQDSYAIKLKNNDCIGEKVGMFLVSSLNKIYNKYDWGKKSGWERVKNDYIKLPTKNNEIDFQFMEDFIAELEAQRIAELEAYLTVTGLKNYQLTEDEKYALEQLEKIFLTSYKYKLGDLFEINNTTGFNKDQLTIGNQYDYITRTSNNQGILQTTGFVNHKNLNPSKTWSLGLLQMDFFYRKREWYAGQFVRMIEPKINFLEKTTLFMTTILNKQKSILLNVLVRDVDTTFNNLKVKLPTQNNEIDFEFMETLISAVQKLVIKEVVDWTDAKINATQEVINR